jgi:DNA-binding NtrC family response regulator
VVLEVPALRQRIGDLPQIAASLLTRLATERSDAPKRLSARAVVALGTHTWPGNVRELENSLRAAALFSEGDVIELEDFTENVQGLQGLSAAVEGSSISLAELAAAPPTLRMAVPPFASPTASSESTEPTTSDERRARATDVAYSAVRGGVSLGEMKRRIERECIARALSESDGNITRAATLLGMKRPRLSQLVKQYGLSQSGGEGSGSGSDGGQGPDGNDGGDLADGPDADSCDSEEM